MDNLKESSFISSTRRHTINADDINNNTLKIINNTHTLLPTQTNLPTPNYSTPYQSRTLPLPTNTSVNSQYFEKPYQSSSNILPFQNTSFQLNNPITQDNYIFNTYEYNSNSYPGRKTKWISDYRYPGFILKESDSISPIASLTTQYSQPNHYQLRSYSVPDTYIRTFNELNHDRPSVIDNFRISSKQSEEPIPNIQTQYKSRIINTTSDPLVNKPIVTTTVWKDERTLCYQVEIDGIAVVRRADNDMINGTKLLNVTKMTRGRRDGILKAEKIRHVVKIGAMNLKGVWIPFDRAYCIAKREKIVEKLYPLFVKDIQSIIDKNSTKYFKQAHISKKTQIPTPPPISAEKKKLPNVLDLSKLDNIQNTP